MPASTRVNTGERTEYIFKVANAGNWIDVYNNARGAPDHFEHHYHTFEGKGATAIRRLVEEHAQLRSFYDATRKLALTDPHGRLTGFAEVGDMDDDQEEAFEKVGEVIFEIAELEEE